WPAPPSAPPAAGSPVAGRGRAKARRSEAWSARPAARCTASTRARSTTRRIAPRIRRACAVEATQDKGGGAMRRRGRSFKLRPDGPAAWNNLAHVLVRQKRPEDAIAAAETALHLAQSDLEPYRATLGEVSR